MLHEPVKALKPLPMLELPKIPGNGREQTLQEWHAAGGSVPVQYKSKPHVWHAKVKKYAEGGPVGGEAYGNAPDSSDGGVVQDAQHFQAGGIAKLLKAAKPMVKAASEILPAAEREANLAKMMEGSAAKNQLYHGTGEDIQTFDKSKIKRPAFGKGFHLAESPSLASFYAGQWKEGQNVMPVRASIKNPFELKDMSKWYDIPGDTDAEKTAWIQSKGFDGIKYHHGPTYDAPNESGIGWVAFEPQQIKSSTGNRGTYDVKDPDITKKAGGAIHMADGGAAFGKYPAMKASTFKGKKEAQDRIPLDVARGAVAGVLGMPGDLETLGRLGVNLAFGPGGVDVSNESFLPTSEDIEKRIPFRGTEPVNEAFAGFGSLVGGLSPAPAKAAIKGAKAVGRGALQVAEKAIENANVPVDPLFRGAAGRQRGVVKLPGGNFLTGKVEGDIKHLKTQQSTDYLEDDLRDLRSRFGNLPAYERADKNIQAAKALDNWVDSNLTKYIKNEMGSPKDPVRQLFDQKALDIEAKYAKDVERADRTAQRAADEPDPQRKANLERESRRLSSKALADRNLAEEHITHRKGIEENNNYFSSSLDQRRMNAGFPESGLAESRAGQAWEQASDQAIETRNAGNIQRAPEQAKIEKELEQKYLEAQENLNKEFNEHIIKNKNLTEGEMFALNYKTPYPVKARAVNDTEYKATRKKLDDFRNTFNNEDVILAKENPWISKVDPNSSVYSTFTDALGFNHIIDVLKADMAAGRIRPEQLNKMSMEQAVRRTAEYDLDAAKVAAAARAKSLEGMPVYKEYPEGYKWVQLDQPGQFAQESNVMGHSVRGYEPPRGHAEHIPESGFEGSDYYGHGGYEAIKSGKAKVYSLRDPEGMSHATVEVKTKNADWQDFRNAGDDANAAMQAAKLRMGITPGTEGPYLKNMTADQRYAAQQELNKHLSDIYIEKYGRQPPREITQIKGKSNAAPKEEYIPYIQDFVKSGNWSDVGDLGNTGLYSSKDVAQYTPENFSMSRNARLEAIERARQAKDLPNYMTRAEYEAMLQKHAPEEWVAKKAQRAAEDDQLLRELRPPEQGMAHGGEVHMQVGGVMTALGAFGKLGKAGAKLSAKELQAVKEAGRVAHASEASARAAKDAEVAQQMASLPARSKSANEALGLYHPVGGGVKLSKPVTGMHATTVADPRFKQPVIKNITPEQLVKEEAALFPLVGDRAAGGRYLTHVGENELEEPVRLTAGARYMDANYNPVNPEESAAWESGLARVTALGRQAERAGEGGRPVYGVYTSGSGTNTDFNVMGANALLQQLPYSKITKKAAAEFDNAMREGTKVHPPLPDWPGILSPETYDLVLDKSNGIMRTKLFDIMGKEKFQSMGFPDVPATRKAIVEPELLDVPTNQAGFRLARMDTTGRIIENPIIPSDYPSAMAGKVAGTLDRPEDYKDIWQSHFGQRRLLSQPESGDYYSFSRAHPIQYADQEWLDKIMQGREKSDELSKIGKYARGGSAKKKPSGGLASINKKQSSRSHTAKET